MCKACREQQPLTGNRCSACKSRAYKQKRYGCGCICGVPGPMDSNGLCRACNNEAGLRECRRCRQVQLTELSFETGRYCCRGCRNRARLIARGND